MIELSKFAQTFTVRFLKSSSIYPICINAWGSFSFNTKYDWQAAVIYHKMRREWERKCDVDCNNRNCMIYLTLHANYVWLVCNFQGSELYSHSTWNFTPVYLLSPFLPLLQSLQNSALALGTCNASRLFKLPTITWLCLAQEVFISLFTPKAGLHFGLLPSVACHTFTLQNDSDW